MSILLSGEVDQQSVENHSAGVFDRLDVFAHEPKPFFDRKVGVFGSAVGNSHDYIVEHFACSLKNVQMAVCDRVEGAWIDAGSHFRKFGRTAERTR